MNCVKEQTLCSVLRVHTCQHSERKIESGEYMSGASEDNVLRIRLHSCVVLTALNNGLEEGFIRDSAALLGKFKECWGDITTPTNWLIWVGYGGLILTYWLLCFSISFLSEELLRQICFMFVLEQADSKLK
ncbi:hypothetical protein CRYUN_Cryun05aG0239500 [Craigia yunnanensis]